MLQFRSLAKKAVPVCRIGLSLVWLSLLSGTDSYFSAYVLIGFLSFFLQIKGEAPEGAGKHRLFSLVLGAVFSLLVLLANYPLFTTIGDPALISRSTSLAMNLINGVLCFTGGICVFKPVFSWFFVAFPRKTVCSSVPVSRKLLPWLVFGGLALIHLIHLFLVEYPGNLTEDTFTQMSEMLSGSYSNFNTFWHTMLFQGVLTAGYALFQDVNAAVAVFTVLQLLILTGAFTYCLMTLHDYGVPRAALAVFGLIYGLVPYHLALSITVWKDVLFAAAVLLMLSSWMRILKDLGQNRLWNEAVFLLGSLLFLLARSNGWMIYLVTFLVVLLFSRKDRRFLVLMGSLALVGWFLLNPALTLLGVGDDDPVESFSVPIQQVSRVIAEGHDLSEADEALLSRVIDLEEVPELYVNWLSDPMKVEFRSKDYDYLISNLDQYRELWLRLGLKYPWTYVKAWVDQTRGYWNGGYDYAMYSETVTDNPYGVVKSGGGNPIASLFRLYFGLSRHLVFFEPLHSIGLHVWLVILCFLLNLKNRKLEWVLSLPLLILVAGLWLGTPVYACFRYVYPLFASFPLLLSAALWNPEKK